MRLPTGMSTWASCSAILLTPTASGVFAQPAVCLCWIRAGGQPPGNTAGKSALRWQRLVVAISASCSVAAFSPRVQLHGCLPDAD